MKIDDELVSDAYPIKEIDDFSYEIDCEVMKFTRGLYWKVDTVYGLTKPFYFCNVYR